MSKRDEVNEACRVGVLRQVPLSIEYVPTLRPQRTLCVTPEILEQLSGPWASVEEEDRWSALRADLDAFIVGEFISVPFSPKKNKDSKMARLCPPGDGFWEFRSRKPKPGLRILGGFVEYNFFVGLICRRRLDLGGKHSREWNLAICECVDAWRAIFSEPPLATGVYPDAYLSNFDLIP